MKGLNFDGASQELARRDLLTFCKRMEPAFTDPPHIHLLVDLLTQLENPTSGLNRLCISLPPRFGKTTLCSQLFPAWAIGAIRDVLSFSRTIPVSSPPAFRASVSNMSSRLHGHFQESKCPKTRVRPIDGMSRRVAVDCSASESGLD